MIDFRYRLRAKIPPRGSAATATRRSPWGMHIEITIGTIYEDCAYHPARRFVGISHVRGRVGADLEYWSSGLRRHCVKRLSGRGVGPEDVPRFEPGHLSNDQALTEGLAHCSN